MADGFVEVTHAEVWPQWAVHMWELWSEAMADLRALAIFLPHAR
jgi:hypothetical protein